MSCRGELEIWLDRPPQKSFNAGAIAAYGKELRQTAKAPQRAPGTGQPGKDTKAASPAKLPLASAAVRNRSFLARV